MRALSDRRKLIMTSGLLNGKRKSADWFWLASCSCNVIGVRRREWLDESKCEHGVNGITTTKDIEIEMLSLCCCDMHNRVEDPVWEKLLLYPSVASLSLTFLLGWTGWVFTGFLHKCTFPYQSSSVSISRLVDRGGGRLGHPGSSIINKWRW